MRRRYINAMALVQKFGKPNIFLTMACNPMWKEIQEFLQYGEDPNDRPDLLSRVFRAKVEILKNELINKKIFGEVAACVYAIEYQKRGFPHAHFLLILKPQFKPLNPEAFDKIVSAEIPDPDENSHLYNAVKKHMVHGPCGDKNKKNVCMRNGSCKNRYPKEFCDYTTHAEDGYPQYRRRNNQRKIRVRYHDLDNRWIAPHNPYLVALLDCHINVEICSTIKLVKYIYKCIYKGHDYVSFHVVTPEDDPKQIDEIKNFQDGRWISPPEALWRIYKFPLSHMNPSVYTLQVHLHNQQLVSYHRHSDLVNLLRNIDFSRTMLTELFEMNRLNKKAQNLNCLYREFPEHFVWTPSTKLWTERKRLKVIGRLVTDSPTEG